MMSENNAVKTKRNANIELLRIISMCMVVFLHGLNKGGNLVNPFTHSGVNANIAWLLESMAIPAVNIFILISGYFLVKSSFKLERLLGLIFTVIFYSLGVFVVCGLFGIVSFSELNIFDILQYIFPVHMGVYWFMTSYVLVYLLSPVINRGINLLSKKQFGTILVLLLAYECIFKSILPVRLTSDERGYGVLWFLIVYLVGAYFRLYGFKYITGFGKGMAVYLISVAAVLAEMYAIFFVNARFDRLNEISKITLDYNQIFCFLAAVGIFAAFVNKKENHGKVSEIICKISPYALGIYLFHESPALRYEWQKILGIKGILPDNPFVFTVKIFFAVIVIVILGLLIDYLRSLLFGAVSKIVFKTAIGREIKSINNKVNGINE